MEEILHQLICSSSHYLQGFIHPRWCRISSINGMDLLENVIPIENCPIFQWILLVFILESPVLSVSRSRMWSLFVAVFCRFGWNQDWQKGIKILKKWLGQMFVGFLFFGWCFEKLLWVIAINHHRLNAFGFENAFFNPGTCKSIVFLRWIINVIIRAWNIKPKAKCWMTYITKKDFEKKKIVEVLSDLLVSNYSQASCATAKFQAFW